MSQVVRLHEDSISTLKKYDANLNVAIRLMAAEIQHLRKMTVTQKDIIISFGKTDCPDR